MEELAQNEVLDNGKPIWEARMDLDTVISCLEFYGGVAPSINGQHVKLPGGSFAMITKDPLGVVGGVGAWNYPLQTATWKIAPALVCGNTFVYKPSPLTPLNVVLLAEVSLLVIPHKLLYYYIVAALRQFSGCSPPARYPEIAVSPRQYSYREHRIFS